MKITLNQNTEGTTPKDLLGEWTIKGWTKDSDTECTIHLERDVQAQREVFALQMQATIRESRKDGYCQHCGMMTSQCDCWDSVNGGD